MTKKSEGLLSASLKLASHRKHNSVANKIYSTSNDRKVTINQSKKMMKKSEVATIIFPMQMNSVSSFNDSRYWKSGEASLIQLKRAHIPFEY